MGWGVERVVWNRSTLRPGCDLRSVRIANFYFPSHIAQMGLTSMDSFFGLGALLN